MPTLRYTALTDTVASRLASTLRDELLNTVRRYTPELKEAQQREIAGALMDQAQDLIFDVATAVSIGGTFPVVSAVLKDAGLGKNRILLQAATGEEFDKVRARHWNTQVALVLVSAEQFNEERTEPDIVPDQGNIFGRQWQTGPVAAKGGDEDRLDGPAEDLAIPEPAPGTPAGGDPIADSGAVDAGGETRPTADPAPVTVVAPGHRFRTGPVAGTAGETSNLIDYVTMASLLTGTKAGMMAAAAHLNGRERELGRSLSPQELEAERPAARQAAAGAGADPGTRAAAPADEARGKAGRGRPSAEKAAAGAAAFQRGQTDRLAGTSIVNGIPDDLRADSYRLNRWRAGWKAKDKELKAAAAGAPQTETAPDTADRLPDAAQEASGDLPEALDDEELTMAFRATEDTL